MEQKKKCGYEMPTVIKYVKLELEGSIAGADSVIAGTSVKTVGQTVETIDYTKESSFNFTWE